MSYIQLNIGGKERGLKYNQMAILEIGQRALTSKYEPGTLQHDMYSIVCILFAGLRGNAYAKDSVEDFTFEDCTEWIDLMAEGDKEKMVEALTASEKYKETTAFLEGTIEGKKKRKKLPLTNTAASV